MKYYILALIILLVLATIIFFAVRELKNVNNELSMNVIHSISLDNLFSNDSETSENQ